MTSPSDRALPPLRDLPPPPRLPREDTTLLPPTEILLESRRALTGRLLRRSWAPGLVLLGLWLVFVLLYVWGAAPTFWAFALLFAIGDAAYLRATLFGLGFSPSGLWAALLLIPPIATLASAVLLPVASSRIAALEPRRFLSEESFQKAVRDLATAAVMAPPVLALLLVPLLAAVGVPQPWAGVGAGQLTALSLALLAVMGAWLLVRRLLSAPRLLGVEPYAAIEVTARIGRDPVARRTAARRVLAQDRRHLPPVPGTPEAGAGLSPRGMARSLAVIGRSTLTWVLPAAGVLGWLVFGIADAVSMFTRLSIDDLAALEPILTWEIIALGTPLLGLVVLGLSLVPGVAVRFAEGARAEVIDERTYREWVHRARVNPWEARAVTLSGVLAALVALLGLVAAGTGVALLGVGTPLIWTALVMAALVLVPLLGGGAAHSLRSGLRYVLYGPAGDVMRRETPHALVAPDLGTRTDRAQDPAVRAALRKRLQAQGGDHALEIFDLDAAGERLWVDDSAPGARPTEVRAADLGAGHLPDFGAGDGSGSGGVAAAGYGTAEPLAGGRRRDADGGEHQVPESTTGLREL
ncbi:hypothetical protein [Brachybacterium sp. J153]|uniref:hypothetical protein n=1 Tax=Brachybacterium sp. J153 TaxID=3116488 RepID=UPI002E78ACD7|nr:hypothetical protein [Brachybacterium sp. J153]MEE1617796.1 hypothetical protein [Brachybacterium sp. J153]